MILFARAFFLLIIFDAVSRVYRFQTLYAKVRRWKVASQAANENTLVRICRAINYACVCYPKLVQCQQRAFATTYLLRRNGIAAELVLGAQKLPFKAHAWVEVAGEIINERSDTRGYPINGVNLQTAYAVWERF